MVPAIRCLTILLPGDVGRKRKKDHPRNLNVPWVIFLYEVRNYASFLLRQVVPHPKAARKRLLRPHGTNEKAPAFPSNQVSPRGSAPTGVWGPRCPAVNRLRRFPAGEEALEQKKQVFRPRGSAPGGVGDAKGGRALEKAEKTCFFWLRQPYIPLWSSFFASVSFSRERNAERLLLSYSEVKYV